eukprot:TRINITY_DN4061_c0_g1_i1.p1 TRINITY_DN4061_c0_g1~~TRINITY_DN4061_c0_g1_i1.p1  ORF type:complete len:166 (+),score=46.00 TRINITY_DN4061_c0_g1_i1:229-726(+)
MQVQQQLDACQAQLRESQDAVQRLVENGSKCGQCRLLECKDDLTVLSERLDAVESTPEKCESEERSCNRCKRDLQAFVVPATSKFVCDVCNHKLSVGSISRQCSACDFDICEQCVGGRNTPARDVRLPQPVAHVGGPLWAGRAAPVGAGPRRLDFDQIMTLAGER